MIKQYTVTNETINEVDGFWLISLIFSKLTSKKRK